MLVKISRVVETEAGKQYEWVNCHDQLQVGSVRRATGRNTVVVGDVGWMPDDSADFVFVPIAWP